MSRRAIAAVSCLHAYVVGIISLVYTFYFNFELLDDPFVLFSCPADLMTNSPFGGGRPLAVCAVGVSMGYMCHDLVAMLEHRLFEDVAGYTVHLHHVVCIVCFGVAILSDAPKTCALVVCLVCELNTASV